MRRRRCRGWTAPAPSPERSRRPARAGLVLVSRSAQAACSTASISSSPGRDRGARGRERIGKSTLAALLLRLAGSERGPDRGRRCRHRGCEVADWRRHLAWVPQQPHTPSRHRRGQHPARRARSPRRRRTSGRGAGRSRRLHRRRSRTATRPSSATAGGPSRRRAPAHRAGAGIPARRAARHPRRADRRPRCRERRRWSPMPSSGSRRDGRARDSPPVGARPERRSHRPARGGAPSTTRRWRRDRRRWPAARRSRAAAQAGSRSRSCSARWRCCFGIGLMATAGYLISRAAERPAILSLTVVIVAVRFFGLARPVARYLERLVSHDLAFRVLGTPSRALLRADRAAGARRARGVPQGRSREPHGRRRRRAAEPVPERRWDRRSWRSWPALPRSASPRRSCLRPHSSSRRGCWSAASPFWSSSASLGRATGAARRRHGELSAELVELLVARPSSSCTGVRRRQLRPLPCGDADTCARLAHRDALAAASATHSRCSSSA